MTTPRETVASTLNYSEFTYAYDRPQCSAVLKQEYADFQVDEIIGFEFSESGKHLCLQIQKTDKTTVEVAKTIARIYQVKLRDIGYAGMKDRRGVCTQWFSVLKNTRDRVDPNKLESDNTVVLKVRNNDRKIRRGSHRANAFRIRLRQFQGSEDDLRDRVVKVKTLGVPNYFGPQRFGKNMSNVKRAIGYFDNPANSLHKPRRDRLQHSMMLSAARSFLFNKILSQRVKNNSWAQILAGEVLSLDGTSRFFVPSPDDEFRAGGKDVEATNALSLKQELQARLSNLDIHPSGLLYGKIKSADKYLANATVKSLETEVVSRYPELCQGLLRMKVSSARRALRLVPRNLSFKMADSNTVELEFTLTTGGYATAVLRELCLTEEPGVS